MFIFQTIGGWQCTKQSTQHTCRKFSKIQGWAPQETFSPENNCFPSLLPWLKPRETHFFSTRLVGCPELLTDKNQTKVAKSLPVKKRKDKISWTFTFRLHIFLILLPSLFINSTLFRSGLGYHLMNFFTWPLQLINLNLFHMLSHVGCWSVQRQAGWYGWFTHFTHFLPLTLEGHDLCKDNLSKVI